MLPILERLQFKPKDDIVTRVLVLVPTRELGVQVFEVSKNLAKFSQVDIALSVGGLDLRTQEAMLKKVPDIVIATPGRLIDHINNTPTFSVEYIEILVLDEADRMLEECFEGQMKEIIRRCSVNRQTMLFSATMTSQVKELALVSLKNPMKVFVNENTDVAQNLRQEFVRVRKNSEDYREAILAYLVTRSFGENCMVFVQTKIMAHRLNILLGLLGVKSGELHGNLRQTERLMSLKRFKDEEIGVLIATDIAARGLDIKGVKTVINFSMPPNYKRYVHRVGRTARAGYSGRSVSIAGDREFQMLRDIKKNSKSAMFERVLNKDILEKYKVKVDKLEPAIERVLQEELEEKKLRSMEQSIKVMENKLNGDVEIQPQRIWMQTEEGMKGKKRKNAGGQPQKKPTKKTLKRKRRRLDVNDPNDKKVMVETQYHLAKVKKSNKQKRLNAVQENAVSERGFRRIPAKTTKSKPKSSKSSFDEELTRTDTKSVKRFRFGASYSERKASFLKKNPGKKFDPKQKQKYWF